jgi:hypothetical protein
MINTSRALYRKSLRGILTIALVGVLATIAAPRPGSASVVAADTPVPPTPIVSPKNGTQEMELDVAKGTTLAMPPSPASKNYDRGVPDDKPFEGSPVPAQDLPPKNRAGDVQTATSLTDAAAVLSAGASLITCGASGNMNWTTTSSSFEVIRQCTFSVPQNGWVFLSANGSMANSNGEYEALFRIGVDSTSGDYNVDRWVNVYNDGGDGTDKSVALSVLKPVTAGTHTFYFLGKRYGGAATVLVYDPTLTVIFIPAADSEVLACGASGNMNWTTTSSSFEVIRQCALSIPRDGWVFLSADGSMANSNGEYEALFRIGIDSTSGDYNVDRWANVYNDAGDGTDESVALSVLKPVTAGTHAFYFLGKRYSGTTTALVYDPTLTAVYVPAPSVTALTCGASGNMNWTTTSSSFEVIRQCTFSVPQDGWVFLSADGSMANSNGEYEALFRIGVDSTSGDYNVDRWVNVYNDGGDGTDKSVALSVLKQVTAGTHAFYLLGRRYSGTATVLVYDPTLTVIVPGARVFLPLVMRGL